MFELPVDERNDFEPVCPHCGKELDRLIARKLASSMFSKRLVYCCPHCHKVLGVSHRKGMLANYERLGNPRSLLNLPTLT